MKADLPDGRSTLLKYAKLNQWADVSIVLLLILVSGVWMAGHATRV